MNTLSLAVRRSSARAATALSRMYTASSRVCPSCSAPLPTPMPTCPNCFHIEPLPKSTTYFDMFDLSSLQNRFEVDTGELKRRFLKAQRICHPDAWSAKGEKELGIAAAQSSLLNAAYRTLLSPVLRAQYILSQEGFQPSETDKLTDQELVMEVMESREELDEAETLDDVEHIRTRNNIKIEETHNSIAKLINEKKWEEARDAAVKLKYLEGIDSAAKDKYHALLR
ncbi:hypothetical protein M0805_004299 [Coniferiporia weirii]|nr:hypothetical protein M0805_004299 [Coniferiporia weirii]